MQIFRCQNHIILLSVTLDWLKLIHVIHHCLFKYSFYMYVIIYSFFLIIYLDKYRNWNRIFSQKSLDSLRDTYTQISFRIPLYKGWYPCHKTLTRIYSLNEYALKTNVTSARVIFCNLFFSKQNNNLTNNHGVNKNETQANERNWEVIN